MRKNIKLISKRNEELQRQQYICCATCAKVHKAVIALATVLITSGEEMPSNSKDSAKDFGATDNKECPQQFILPGRY